MITLMEIALGMSLGCGWGMYFTEYRRRRRLEAEATADGACIEHATAFIQAFQRHHMETLKCIRCGYRDRSELCCTCEEEVACQR